MESNIKNIIWINLPWSRSILWRNTHGRLNASWKINSLAVNGQSFLVIDGYLLNPWLTIDHVPCGKENDGTWLPTPSVQHHTDKFLNYFKNYERLQEFIKMLREWPTVNNKDIRCKLKCGSFSVLAAKEENVVNPKEFIRDDILQAAS